MTAFWFDLFGIISFMVFIVLYFTWFVRRVQTVFTVKGKRLFTSRRWWCTSRGWTLLLNIQNTPNTAVKSAAIRRLSAIRLKLSCRLFLLHRKQTVVMKGTVYSGCLLFLHTRWSISQYSQSVSSSIIKGTVWESRSGLGLCHRRPEWEEAGLSAVTR